MFLLQCNARDIRAAFPGGKRAAVVRRYPALLFCLCFSCMQCVRVSVIHGEL